MRHASRRPRSTPAGFTLVELLVVMGIIGLLATITVVAVNTISKDARLSSGVNAVTSGLDNARALAIKKNTMTLVVFRVRYEQDEPQVTEMVVGEWTGESIISGFNQIIDRFVVSDSVQARTLPAGVKVAGPWYDVPGQSIDDQRWITQPEFTPSLLGPQVENIEGRMIGVMFAPNGSIVTRSPFTQAYAGFIDFDQDGIQDKGSSTGGSQWWQYDELDDESNVEPVPFLAVYDDRAAREIRTLDWSVEGNYVNELTGPNGYITTNADRLHFNRYTGVAMR